MKNVLKKLAAKKPKKLTFDNQDRLIFGAVMITLLFAIFQLIQAQVRVNHSDWPQYANAEGNFSFRYPEEWGAPEARQFDFPERPNYFYMVFPQAPHISFGGSLNGYEHPGRTVAPTDDPGFVRTEEGDFFTPGHNSANRPIPANRLSIIEGIDAKCLYNFQEYDELYQSSFGIIRCNVPHEPFNGVNFVITNPDDHQADRKLLLELMSTFKKSI